MLAILNEFITFVTKLIKYMFRFIAINFFLKSDHAVTTTIEVMAKVYDILDYPQYIWNKQFTTLKSFSVELPPIGYL